uniref:Uncharacterized protein n=1 Tax=Chelonoidis abingdonii TaxID=106734 RepID=A0A8C0H3Y3_CHEAB
MCNVHDELKGPQSNVRDGEEVVIANIFASWLQSVADKITLFVSPDCLCSYHEDHNTENEQDSEPDLPNTGGCSPVHLLFCIDKFSHNLLGKNSE